MGPLPWAELPASEAMEEAKKLVRLCVLAGYKKIHLDTSMKLGDDDENEKLSYDVMAERGVILYKECMKAYKEMLVSCGILEKQFDAMVKALPDESRALAWDFVMLCEDMSRRALEIACENMEIK